MYHFLSFIDPSCYPGFPFLPLSFHVYAPLTACSGPFTFIILVLRGNTRYYTLIKILKKTKNHFRFNFSLSGFHALCVSLVSFHSVFCLLLIPLFLLGLQK